ncbi:MAG: helix-turn-helix domain-containing protein [Desulfuromonadales bacterium]|nr:helix-turn-helix domain-containing protein [Desulfuromonadales bacterium]
MAKESSYKRIEAIKVTVSILRMLADQRQPVSCREVARAVGIPEGTVQCHLATLEDEHLVRSIGGSWELDMGLALFWARRKAMLAGRIARDTDELNQLEV